MLDIRADHSFHCPECDAPNIKVNVANGKWTGFGCGCSSTEACKRSIRNALSTAKHPNQTAKIPIKPIRPKAQRAWTYCDLEGISILQVLRSDDGHGNRKIWQCSLVEGRRSRDVASQVVPQGFHETKRALEDGASYVFIPEGEQCADALR